MRYLGYARTFGYAVAALVGLGIIWIGGGYLLDPGGSAPTFGVPDPPPASDPFLLVKGVRDVGFGVVVLALLITRQRLGVGVALLAASIIPIGDASIVLGRGGPASTAFGVHGATAAVMILGSVALLVPANKHREERRRRSTAESVGG